MLMQRLLPLALCLFLPLTAAAQDAAATDAQSDPDRGWLTGFL